MKKALFFLLLAVNLFAINCGDFTGEFKTFNGHYYAITGNKMSFQNAKNFAQANNGYLAIPNTLAENNFIKEIVGSNNEAWIGVYDPNYTQSLCFTNNCYSTSRSRFKTVQGTSLSFQNWDSTDIENQFMEHDDTVDSMDKPIISLLGEHWALLSGNTGLWRDWGTHFFTGENPALQKAVIEFDTKPTCYEAPSTVTGEITGRVCNSQVWDTVLGVQNGTTAECLSDKNNIEYCPQSLAECGQQWDYENGYSVSGVGSVIDYTNKVSSSTTVYSDKITTITGGGTSKYKCPDNWGTTSCFVSKSFSVPSCTNGTMIKSPLSGYEYMYPTAYSFSCSSLVCPTGYIDNGTNCETTTTTQTCPSGYTETTGTETAKGQCKTNQNYTYYTYLCNSGYTPISSGGNTGKTD
ncbi:MAG: lectin-like protein, partial [Candidatus Woesearchaeota archaeon]